MSVVVITLLALALGGVGLVAMVTGIYNKLVTYRNRYKNAFAQIDVQLKRRSRLDPESRRDRRRVT